MAFRTWRKLLLAALGVAVLAGAGQLGFAYGLGIVRIARTFDSTAANQWTAQLAWVSWFPMVAAVAGAVAGEALGRRHGQSPSAGSRTAFAAVAALGAAAVAPLCMLPARAAQIESGNPVLATGLSAGLGAIIGFFAAVAVLTYRPIGWNVAAITGGIWLLALVSVAPSLGPTDPLPAVRLGVLDPTSLNAGTTQRLAVLTMPALALLAGAASGALARWRGHPMFAVAACGAAGPTMLALAYVTAGPGGSADKYQAAPYWGALLAAGAGALGSALATIVRTPPTGAGEEPPALDATDVGPARKGRPQGAARTSGDGGVITPEADVPEAPPARTGRAAKPRSRRSNPDRTAEPSASTDAPGRRGRAPTRDLPRPDGPRQGDRERGDRQSGGLEDADPPGGKAGRRDTGSGNADRGDTGSGDAEPGTSGRTRRGVFGQRRGAKPTEPRSAGGAGSPAAEAPGKRPARGRDRTDRPLAERDEEFVDWVSGLSAAKPEPDGEAADSAPRRSVRSSGRHHSK